MTFYFLPFANFSRRNQISLLAFFGFARHPQRHSTHTARNEPPFSKTHRVSSSLSLLLLAGRCQRDRKVESVIVLIIWQSNIAFDPSTWML
jgi:hypothetical protein